MNQPAARSDASLQRVGGFVAHVAGPALVMLVVASIAFFLVEVLYQGPFVDRIKWILTLFCFATVLISRISIAEGFERASLFGGILGLATFLVASQFMQGNPLFLIGIMAFVWWAAGRLTWDCTFIDASRDASGQGMTDLAIDQFHRWRRGQSAGPEQAEPTTEETAGKPAAPPAAVVTRRSAWDRFVQIFWRRKQPNTPGLWAFYFLLLGLPLFGIGQLFLAMNDEVAHRAAAFHFFGYVTGLLGLLMLCSVLGLHRYLQKNQSSMPAAIARRWIVAGTLLAIGITAFCYVLPRPTASYSIANWLPKLTSPKTGPSQISFGNDGQQESDSNLNAAGGPASRPNQQNPAAATEKSGGGNQRTSQQGPNRDSSGGEHPGGSPNDGKSGAGGQKQGDENGQKTNPGTAKQQAGPRSGDRANQKSDSQKSDSQESSNDRDRPAGTKSSGPDSPEKSDQNRLQPREGKQGSASSRRSATPAGERSASSSQNSAPPRDSPAGNPWQFLGKFLQWAIWCTALLVVLWFTFRHRNQVMPWLRSFLAEMAEYWNRLWNRPPRPAARVSADPASPTQKEVKLPRFHEFRNPFLSDAGQAWPPDELVRYTFAAFEAWARDHGSPRTPDQTAIEFAEVTATKFVGLRDDANLLTRLYSHLAYARASNPAAGETPAISRSTVQALASFWEKLTTMAPQSTVGVA